MKENWRKKLFKIYAAHPERFPKGSVEAVVVMHQAHCGAHEGRRCNCDPGIAIKMKDGTTQDGEERPLVTLN